MDNPSKSSKKSIMPYIIAGIGLVAFFVFSAFKSGTSASSSKSSSCQDDPDCLLGYWKWRIKNSPEWLDSITKGATNSIAVNAAIERNAQWQRDTNAAPDSLFQTWETMVDSETNRVLLINKNMRYNDARVLAISNILNRL